MAAAIPHLQRNATQCLVILINSVMLVMPVADDYAQFVILHQEGTQLECVPAALRQLVYLPLAIVVVSARAALVAKEAAMLRVVIEIRWVLTVELVPRACVRITVEQIATGSKFPMKQSAPAVAIVVPPIAATLEAHVKVPGVPRIATRQQMTVHPVPQVASFFRVQLAVKNIVMTVVIFSMPAAGDR